MTDNPLWQWIDDTFLDLGRQLRWSYLPPLMVYLAAGVSGLTAIVGTFFIKEYLDLSAAFLAGLAFWAGIPWTLKMPLGHLVDLIWRRKTLLVYIGASLITLSILIMYGIIAHTAAMAEILRVEAWFVIATILAPTGYVVQDVVADAMTVEAVPSMDEHGEPYADSEIKTMHTTMQTLGRVAIIGGFAAVAALNITMFSGVENMSEEMKIDANPGASRDYRWFCSGRRVEYHHVQRCRRYVRGNENRDLRRHLPDSPGHSAVIDIRRYPGRNNFTPACATHA